MARAMGRGVSVRATAVITAALLTAMVGCTTPPVPLAHFPTADTSVVTPGDAEVAGPLHMRGADLVDATGRVVLIHGVNSVDKSAPYISPLVDGWLGPADFDYFRRSGFNGVRLGIWPAQLMPSPGVIDHDYLESVAAVVEQIRLHHMWVMLDFHQDVFTGMPQWATTPDAAALSSDAPAYLSFLGWSASYFSPRSVRQWDDFWSNAEVGPGRGVVDAYGDGIAAVAARFRDATNVVGIELINEPSPGSNFLSCVFDGCAGHSIQFAARMGALTDRVRAVAPEMAVWWYPIETQFGVEPMVPAPSVTSTSNGARVGVSFHPYCYQTDGGEPVAPPSEAIALCNAQFSNLFANALDLRRRFGGAAMITEFGASNNPLNAALTTAMADDHLLSWLHWHYPGAHPEVVETQLVRTFAQATAGSPVSQHYDTETGDFTFVYTTDHAISAPTTISVPPRAYPAGYHVTVTGGSVTSAPDEGRLTVVADAGAATVSVHVTRV